MTREDWVTENLTDDGVIHIQDKGNQNASVEDFCRIFGPVVDQIIAGAPAYDTLVAGTTPGYKQVWDRLKAERRIS